MSEILEQLALPQLIRASAGTGKTFRLTNRMITLLAEGELPHRLLATTFTRKAAGEIRERLLDKLAQAAMDEKACEQLREFAHKDIDARRAIELIGHVLGELHRLNICTLDSFFIGIAQGFALELGLPPGWRLVDETEDARLRRQAIAASLEDNDHDRLLRLVRMLNPGLVVRSVHNQIDSVIGQFYETFRQTDEDAWNWLQPPPPLDQDQVMELLGSIRIEDLPTTQKGTPVKNYETALRNDIAYVRQQDWQTLIGKGIAAAVFNGTMTYCKKPIPAPLVEVYEQLIAHAKSVLLWRLADRTRATYELLARFDHHYTQLKRQTGAMTFSDVTHLLAGEALTGMLEQISYRLDGHIAHLLLDEFQDTSLDQWKVLEPIADDVLAVGDGSKTFFCVGDVKQAIYGWRGGVAEIFDTLQNRWPQLVPEPMDKTWRCSQPVVDTVNEVFGNLENNALLAEHPAVTGQWAQHYQHHTTGQDKRKGYVQLVTTELADGAEESGGTGGSGNQSAVTLEDTAALVKRLYDRCPDAQIGVLVRTNAAVARLIYEMRKPMIGLPASEEGGNPLTDSPAVSVVLSLLRLADHPEDGVSAYHVRTSPLGPIVGLASRDSAVVLRVAAQTRHALARQGYGPVIWGWAKRLAEHCDRRDLGRLMQLVEMARRHEGQATPRTTDFVSQVEQVKVEDPSSARVRVMTIHQAKGLEFDVVVLPELDKKLISDNAQSPMAFRDDPTHAPRLVSCYASQAVRAFDDRLKAMHEQGRRRQLRESLSVLYVAMTRAKHALYMVIAPSKTNEGKVPQTFAGLLRCALTDAQPTAENQLLYEHGDGDWHTDIKPQHDRQRPDPPTLTPPKLAKPTEHRTRGLAERTPSDLAGGSKVNLADHLRLHAGPAALRGTIFHLWYEQIDWLDASAPPDRSALRQLALARGGSAGQLDNWLDQFFASLEQPAIRQTLSRAGFAEGAILMREQRFAVRDGDDLVSGAIDRLVVEPGRAVVIDYKTDAAASDEIIEQLTEHYRPQIEAYRRAAVQLTGLAIEQIESRLLFVGPGRSVLV